MVIDLTTSDPEDTPTLPIWIPPKPQEKPNTPPKAPTLETVATPIADINTPKVWGEDIEYQHSDEEEEPEEITKEDTRQGGTDSPLTSPPTSPLGVQLPKPTASPDSSQSPVEICGVYRELDKARESQVIDKRDDYQDETDSPLSSPPDSPFIVRPTVPTPTPSPNKIHTKTPSPRKTLGRNEQERAVINAGNALQDEIFSPLSSPPDSPIIVAPTKPTPAPTPKRPSKLWREATSLWQGTDRLWGQDIPYSHSDEDSESEETPNPRQTTTDSSLLTSPPTSPHPSRPVSQQPPRPRKPAAPLDPGVMRTETSGVGRLSYDPTQPRPNGQGNVFGDLPGLFIGKRWHSRMGAGWDGTHANPMSGIATYKREGATAIALSGGYEDDIDEGYRFLYSGSGGKGKGSGVRQAKDQVWNRTNSGLRENILNERPVRVIRGSKGDPVWSPTRGFMYCGLYEVVACWVEAGSEIRLFLGDCGLTAGW
jgi:SAD/SRA domain